VYSVGIRLTASNTGGNPYTWEIFNHGTLNGFCIYDRTAGAYRMYIDKTGYVCIGSTTPNSNYLLDVIGNIHSAGTSTLGGAVSIGTTAAPASLNLYGVFVGN